MTIRLLTGPLAAAFLVAASAGALAAPEDDYVALMTAVEIDKACVGLKYMESVAVRNLAWDYLAQTGRHAHWVDGRLPDDEYQTWLAALDQKSRDAAAAAGCTELAAAPILMARAKAAEQLYQGLVLAFYFDSIDDIVYRNPLDDYEKQSAAGYDTYLQQLYGASFQQFVDYGRQMAMQQLPTATDHYGLDGGFDTGLDFLTPEGSSKLFNASSTGRSTINQVQFEVTAEVNGYLVRPLDMPSGHTIPALNRPGGTESWPVVNGPGSMLFDSTPEVSEDSMDSWSDLYWAAVVRPDRGLRVMFYGKTATSLVNPVVRLYARNTALPEGTSASQAFDAPSFRDTATAYDPVVVTEPCLGGPCYDFPPEVTDALLAFGSDNLAELFVATAPDAPSSFTLRQGRLDVFYLWHVLNGE